MREAAANSSPSFPMATEEFIASISPLSVEEQETLWGFDSAHGADLRFLGIVRDTENGRPILGIDYSCYPEMAEKELWEIGRSMRQDHPGHQALVHHRVGFVPVGIASLVIRVRTRHSAEAFELVREYLRRIKTAVPVWKSVKFREPVSDA
jgi:molybdopterin synthase catalytic subunit